jgi:hypothetical protein
MMHENDPRHGTVNGYSNLGCRCQPCRDAWAVYHRERGYQARYIERCVASSCGTPECERKPDRAYMTGYCYRCGVDLGLRPSTSGEWLGEWL